MTYGPNGTERKLLDLYRAIALGTCSICRTVVVKIKIYLCPNDTTSDVVKTNCITNLNVLRRELAVIPPTHIIFYTNWSYDRYIPAVFDSYEMVLDEIKSIGKRKMPWQEAAAALDKERFQVLRVGHPQYKTKKDFVREIAEWIKTTE